MRPCNCLWTSGLAPSVSRAVGAETVFDHWTRRIEVTPDLVVAKTDAVATEPGSSRPRPVRQWELRPLYQRVLMSVSILGFGTGLGVIFLSARSRIVRRLLHGSSSIQPVHQNVKNTHVYANGIKTTVGSHYIVVETVANWGPGRGKVFLKKDCELRPGRGRSLIFNSTLYITDDPAR